MKMERAGLCLFRSIDCRVEHASLGLPGVELSLSLRGDRAGRSADVSPGSSAPRFRPGVSCRQPQRYWKRWRILWRADRIADIARTRMAVALQ